MANKETRKITIIKVWETEDCSDKNEPTYFVAPHVIGQKRIRRSNDTIYKLYTSSGQVFFSKTPIFEE